MLSKFPDQCKYKGKATVTQHNSPLHIIPVETEPLRGEETEPREVFLLLV